MKRILLVTIDKDATDRRCWSGIPFSIRKELNNHYEVDVLGISTRSSIRAMIEVMVERYICRRFSSVQFTKAFAKKASSILRKKLNQESYDCVITFSVRSSSALSYLETKVPIVLFSDCVMASMMGYYWFPTHRLEKQANDIQLRALKTANHVVLTSEWAKQAAIEEYGVPADMIDIVHFGANVEIESFQKQKHNGVNLLFVGIDGARKGVDIAIDCVRWLCELDPDRSYHLDIVGCSPKCADNPNITVHGLLNRNNPRERELLESLRAAADFFILPTRAECAGIVFNEAGAYSIPSITYRTGGIPDYVIDGENGILLDLSATGKDFAERLIEVIDCDGEVERLGQVANEMYHTEYNWQRAGERFVEIIERLTSC